MTEAERAEQVREAIAYFQDVRRRREAVQRACDVLGVSRTTYVRARATAQCLVVVARAVRQ
jgi:hypothetical protein